MLLDSEDNELLSNKSILTGFNSFDILFEDSTPSTTTDQTTQSTKTTDTFTNSSVLFEFLNSYSNKINNFILNLIYDLQSHCVEPKFEFKIFIILILALFVILVLIALSWKIFGSLIDNFYKNQSKFYSTLCIK